MKKQVRKFIQHRRYASWRKRKKMRLPLAFASLFALVMVAYGVSLLFAAPTVTFSFNPASQTASPGQTKSLVISVRPNNNDVNGGTVRVNYDTNRLTFSKFTGTN